MLSLLDRWLRSLHVSQNDVRHLTLNKDASGLISRVGDDTSDLILTGPPTGSLGTAERQMNSSLVLFDLLEVGVRGGAIMASLGGVDCYMSRQSEFGRGYESVLASAEGMTTTASRNDSVLGEDKAKFKSYLEA